jgi:hypothetical protein
VPSFKGKLAAKCAPYFEFSYRTATSRHHLFKINLSTAVLVLAMCFNTLSVAVFLYLACV